MTKCSEVMTKHVVCCLPDDTVSEVAQLMKREDVGPIPVVQDVETKKLVGIVTDRDLALKIVAEERDPKSTKVKEVMTRDLVTCKADDDIKKAIDAMVKHQLRHFLYRVIRQGIDRVVCHYVTTLFHKNLLALFEH